MVKRNSPVIDTPTTPETALATFDQDLADFGSNPLYDALLSPIRLLIKTELNKAIKAFKADVVSDINSVLDEALSPIYALVDRLPVPTLKKAIKAKLTGFVNSLKTDLKNDK